MLRCLGKKRRVRNSMRSAICEDDNPSPCIIMLPLTKANRTFSGDISFRPSRLGARVAPPSWHTAQRCLYSASPVLFVVVSCGAAA